jgi:SAM-dependent methyltransferase
MADEPLPVATRGFGRAAGIYDRGRPGYPPEAIEALALAPGMRVADVGAGTGKLTALLVPSGAQLVAVEPVAAMRERLAAALPGVRVLDGTAERLPLADASMDLVVAGQAFHWFATAAALAEFARVLAPDRRLGLIWNTMDEQVDWVAQAVGVVDRHQGDAPRHKSGRWRQAFEGQPHFGPLTHARFAHTDRRPLAAMVDRLGSTSFIAALDDGERAAVLAEVQAVLRRVSAPDGTVSMPYLTDVWTARRSPGA